MRHRQTSRLRPALTVRLEDHVSDIDRERGERKRTAVIHTHGNRPADGREAIAETMQISPKTVDFHITKARSRLNARTREQAITTALRHGLLD